MGQPDRYTGPVRSGRLWSGERWWDTAAVAQWVDHITAEVPGISQGRIAITAPTRDTAVHLYALPVLAEASLVVLEDPALQPQLAAEQISVSLP